MPPHYSPRSFFRQAPETCLPGTSRAEGCPSSGLSDRCGHPPGSLVCGLAPSSEKQRNEMEFDFREIFRMSCRKGVQAILDEARSHLVDAPESAAAFIESMSRMPDHCHRAMATWLDHRGCWREASRLHGGDAPGWWRKRKNLGHRSAATDPASLRRLAGLIGAWFQRSEGRGSHCVVESVHAGGTRLLLRLL